MAHDILVTALSPKLDFPILDSSKDWVWTWTSDY